MYVQFRVRYVLDRGAHALPGSAKTPDRGLYTYTYPYPLSTVICVCSSGSGMCWTVVCMHFRVQRQLRTVVYTHIPTHIPCLPLYVCAVPGPVYAGPWCRIRRKLRTVIYTHTHTHIPCLPLYVCALPGPVYAGPWCACFSGFGESSGPWFIHVYIRISLVGRVRCMLDRGVRRLPGSVKAPDRCIIHIYIPDTYVCAHISV